MRAVPRDTPKRPLYESRSRSGGAGSTWWTSPTSTGDLPRRPQRIPTTARQPRDAVPRHTTGHRDRSSVGMDRQVGTSEHAVLANSAVIENQAQLIARMRTRWARTRRAPRRASRAARCTASNVSAGSTSALSADTSGCRRARCGGGERWACHLCSPAALGATDSERSSAGIVTRTLASDALGDLEGVRQSRARQMGHPACAGTRQPARAPRTLRS
jgi:hypothetical protein